MAHSLGAAGGGRGGDIFRKAEAAAQRVHSLFTLSGSVCPTQPRPRNPPPPLDQPPFLLLVSPPPRPNDRFCPPTERGVAPFRSNGHWIFFIGLIEEGGGRGGWSWTRFRGIFALESFVSRIWRGEEETGGSVLEISLYEFVVRCCLFLCIINTKLKLSIIIIRNDRI